MLHACHAEAPLKISSNLPAGSFTRLHAHIVEEEGAFTVRVRMHHHMNRTQSCWGEEIAATFDEASLMIGALANDFSIPQNCISIKIVMLRFKDGTIH